MTALPVLRPDWTPPAEVSALMSTRHGGVGVAPFDTLNLASDSHDPAVAENRRRFAAALGAEPRWMHQVHGTSVQRLDGTPWALPPQADAAISTMPGQACTVFAADCLPVLFCTAGGAAGRPGVGAAHAGWRGLAAGVLENTVAALCEATGAMPAGIHAWLGACIGPRQFEVGAEVLQAFGRDPETTDDADFRRQDRQDGSPRWRADLAGLARQRLRACGLQQLSGGHWCTVEDSALFSFRRDARDGLRGGRMAAAIVLRG